MPAIGTADAAGAMKEGYVKDDRKKAGTNSRPEPDPCVYRAQHPGESDAEYADHCARAKERHMKLVDRQGRAKAVKGRLNKPYQEIAVESS